MRDSFSVTDFLGLSVSYTYVDASSLTRRDHAFLNDSIQDSHFGGATLTCQDPHPRVYPKQHRTDHHCWKIEILEIRSRHRHASIVE
jgi:hypothetical protein